MAFGLSRELRSETSGTRWRGATNGPALVAAPGINGFCHLFEVGGFFAGAVFGGYRRLNPGCYGKLSSEQSF
jgi:hypothetical protein